jgi:lysine-N-methylase
MLKRNRANSYKNDLEGESSGPQSGATELPSDLDVYQSDLQPTYAALFHCIGPKCEDPCCGDWDIPVDKLTYRKYRSFPAEQLGSLVSHFVSRNPEGSIDNLYAVIRRKQDGTCPFFGADRLCDIQREYGSDLLAASCSIYPRYLSYVHGRVEGSLSLSCPEAARAVLLDEHFVLREGNLFSGEFRTDNIFQLIDRADFGAFFLSIRSLVTALIRDRSKPLWQRLLIVASLCARLDEIAAEGTMQRLASILDTYRVGLGQGPSAELSNLNVDVATRLDVAIALSDERCRDPGCGQRFRDAFWDFVEGIGSPDSAMPAEDIDRFVRANRIYYEPFVEQSPFILENYLLNYVYQNLFPFGRGGSNRFVTRSMFDESVLLLTQFSWLSSLLIGIAGRYGREFSEEHVIRTVQSFTRAVEHVPQVFEDVLNAAKHRRLDNLRGLAVLLRT